MSFPKHGASLAIPAASWQDQLSYRPDHDVALVTAAPRHAVLIMQPAGGYLLAYENDNIEGTDTQLVTRLTKLTFIQEYPKGNNESTVMWIQT